MNNVQKSDRMLIKDFNITENVISFRNNCRSISLTITDQPGLVSQLLIKKDYANMILSNLFAKEVKTTNDISGLLNLSMCNWATYVIVLKYLNKFEEMFGLLFIKLEYYPESDPHFDKGSFSIWAKAIKTETLVKKMVSDFNSILDGTSSGEDRTMLVVKSFAKERIFGNAIIIEIINKLLELRDEEKALDLFVKFIQANSFEKMNMNIIEAICTKAEKLLLVYDIAEDEEHGTKKAILAAVVIQLLAEKDLLKITNNGFIENVYIKGKRLLAKKVSDYRTFEEVAYVIFMLITFLEKGLLKSDSIDIKTCDTICEKMKEVLQFASDPKQEIDVEHFLDKALWVICTLCNAELLKGMGRDDKRIDLLKSICTGAVELLKNKKKQEEGALIICNINKANLFHIVAEDVISVIAYTIKEYLKAEDSQTVESAAWVFINLAAKGFIKIEDFRDSEENNALCALIFMFGKLAKKASLERIDIDKVIENFCIQASLFLENKNKYVVACTLITIHQLVQDGLLNLKGRSFEKLKFLETKINALQDFLKEAVEPLKDKESGDKMLSIIDRFAEVKTLPEVPITVILPILDTVKELLNEKTKMIDQDDWEVEYSEI